MAWETFINVYRLAARDPFDISALSAMPQVDFAAREKTPLSEVVLKATQTQAGRRNVISHPCTRPGDIISVQTDKSRKRGDPLPLQTAVKHQVLLEKERKSCQKLTS